ncbi:hypothetical protein HYV86_01375 [Candidatus Woesearchaeota archaeon]|nr:hypothetical protein [Candidatus Woesearchaeota archaeon]
MKDVIQKGDEGSRLLAQETFPTLRNNSFIDLVAGYPVVRVPRDHLVVVHGTYGRETRHLEDHARSLVDRLAAQAQRIGATPVGLANIIDTSRSDMHMLAQAAVGLNEGCERHHVAILNGEYAVLGDRVLGNGNMSGVMISIIPADRLAQKEGVLQPFFSSQPSLNRPSFNDYYIVFDPQGQPVFINCDGVGTKTELYERVRKHGRAVDDLLAMNLDDTIKKGAHAQAVVALLELQRNWKSPIPAKIQWQLQHQMKQLGINGILETEDIGWRLAGYNATQGFNLNAAVVSTIDEERLRNPLRSSAGDYLIAIWGNPTPRSNGISLRRRIMTKQGGDAWHNNDRYRDVRDFLTTPSTILYPVFEKLVREGLATNVYHLSGGAWDGKLAVPLATQELYVSVDNLPVLSSAEKKLADWSALNITDLYKSLCMGIEGLVTTPSEDTARDVIHAMGLNAQVIGRLEAATVENSGVRLRAYNGEQVYFSGKK